MLNKDLKECLKAYIPDIIYNSFLASKTGFIVKQENIMEI